ncbi:MmpS family transport accessory protein [Mycobacterium sp. 48b]|uniref:MmpS family transport accessory protein n=1 Tax=Mycobacterium sp. 48b TaxID=3400426 RepID=UPI003AB0D75C
MIGEQPASRRGDREASGAGRRPRGQTILTNGWLPLVTVVAVGVGGLGVWKVHQMSEPGPVPSVLAAQAPEQFTPKQLTYELFGSVGDGGILSYVDIDGHPHKVDLTELPWSHTETTTLTVVSGSMSAQVSGGQVGCRMLVNGVVRDEQSSTHAEADVTCRVKSA